MTGKLAWKNIWRNKTRSFIFIGAVIFGLAVAIFAISLINAISNKQLENAINIETGDFQLHRKGFTYNKELSLFIPDAEQLSKKINTLNGVQSSTERIVVSGLAASTDNSVAIDIKGIKPEKEKAVTTLEKFIVEGTYLDSSKHHQVLISKRNAEKLALKLNQKFVITVKDTSGEFSSDMFRVVGIFKTANSSFDEAIMFVLYDDLQKLTKTNNVFEIAVTANNENNSPEIKKLLEITAGNDVEVNSWKELLPEIAALSKFIKMISSILTIIVLLGLSFGLMNTMNMIIQERTKEIGMLQAIGQSKFHVFLTMLKEAILMTFIGSVGGIIIGIILVSIAAKTGINLGEGLQSTIGINAVIYPKIIWENLPIMFIGSLILTLIAIIPISKVFRLKMFEALKD